MIDISCDRIFNISRKRLIGKKIMELLTIKMLNTAIERIMNQEMAELGLTYTQTTVIGYLIENQDKDVCQKDIEYNLGLTHPTVSSILSRMEANGLISTKPMISDHRYKKIILSEKAMHLSDEINEKYNNMKEKLFDGISSKDREMMNEMMLKILKNTQ